MVGDRDNPASEGDDRPQQPQHDPPAPSHHRPRISGSPRAQAQRNHGQPHPVRTVRLIRLSRHRLEAYGHHAQTKSSLHDRLPLIDHSNSRGAPQNPGRKLLGAVVNAYLKEEDEHLEQSAGSDDRDGAPGEGRYTPASLRPEGEEDPGSR
jgi:hypothetical protein